MAQNKYVFPPDAGSTNSGVAPSIGNCGRGIQRTGDIRHAGDNYPPAQTATLTPGSIGQDVVGPTYDNDAGAPGSAYDRSFDSQAAFNTSGKFSGGDAACEGFDPFSSKQGGPS